MKNSHKSIGKINIIKTAENMNNHFWRKTKKSIHSQIGKYKIQIMCFIHVSGKILKF